MVTTSKPVTILISVFIGLFVLYSVTNIFISEERVGESIIYSDTEGIQKYWTGLPISISNKLYIEPSNDIHSTKEEFKRELQENFDKLLDSKYADTIYDKYAQTIGMNGIIDVFSELDTELKFSSIVLLHIGEYIFSKTTTNPTYGIEVCSRELLNKSPLNGFIWAAVQAFTEKVPSPPSSQLWSPGSVRDLVKYVNNKLCYFRSSKLPSIYYSCIHQVGRSLSYAFDKDQIVQAVEVCAESEYLDFGYTCATGLYMSMADVFSKSSFSPCDTNDFPAPCFRFSGSMFKHLADNGVTYPCDTIPNRYHKIGCIWSEAFNHEPSTKVYEFCEKYKVPFVDEFLEVDSSTSEQSEDKEILEQKKFEYRTYIACIDGFIAAKDFNSGKTAIEKTCNKFTDKFARKYCKKASIARSEESGSVSYNYSLLEYDYNANDILSPIVFPLQAYTHEKNKDKVYIHI